MTEKCVKVRQEREECIFYRDEVCTRPEDVPDECGRDQPKVEVNDWMNGKYVKVQIGGFEVLVYDNGEINFWPMERPFASLPLVVDMKAWPKLKKGGK